MYGGSSGGQSGYTIILIVMRFPSGEFVGICSGISGVVVGVFGENNKLGDSFRMQVLRCQPCNVETTCAEIRSIVDVQMMQSY